MAKSKWTDLKKKGKRGPGYLAILNSKLGKIAKYDKEDMRTLMDDNFAATFLSTHESWVKSERLAKTLNEAIIRGDLGSGETVRIFKSKESTNTNIYRNSLSEFTIIRKYTTNM